MIEKICTALAFILFLCIVVSAFLPPTTRPFTPDPDPDRNPEPSPEDQEDQKDPPMTTDRIPTTRYSFTLDNLTSEEFHWICERCEAADKDPSHPWYDEDAESIGFGYDDEDETRVVVYDHDASNGFTRVTLFLSAFLTLWRPHETITFTWSATGDSNDMTAGHFYGGYVQVTRDGHTVWDAREPTTGVSVGGTPKPKILKEEEGREDNVACFMGHYVYRGKTLRVSIGRTPFTPSSSWADMSLLTETGWVTLGHLWPSQFSSVDNTDITTEILHADRDRLLELGKMIVDEMRTR